MSKKDYTIDYLVPMSEIPCTQWEDVDSRYHGKCKAGLFGGAPSRGTCALKCDNFLNENPNFNRDQYAAELTLYGYRIMEYPHKGLGDFVHWVIKILTLGLVPMCAACSRRRAWLNMIWFKFFRVLTGAGRLTPPQRDMYTPDKSDAVPPPNVAHPDSPHSSPSMQGMTPFEQPAEKKCAPCEAKRKAREAAEAKAAEVAAAAEKDKKKGGFR